MNNKEELAQKADHCFDTGDYENAHLLYRELALLESPDMRLLSELRQTGDLAFLVFLQDLIKKYPSNIELYIAEADWIVRMGRASNAVLRYSKILEGLPYNQDQEFKIRLNRFRAAIKAGTYQTVIDDLKTLWQRKDLHPKVRLEILHNLSEIKGDEGIPIFEQLMEIQEFDPLLKKFFEEKLKALDLRKEISQALRANKPLWLDTD